MKKILVLLLLCCFSACSAVPDPEDIFLQTQSNLAAGASFELKFSTGQKASLFWSEGEQRLSFSAPEAIEGLCYVRDGGGLTVTYEGISAKISEYALPETAAAREIFAAFDAVLCADPESLEMQDGLLQVGGLWVDCETCLPVAMETESWSVRISS